jgi:hypothetical protein
VNSRYSLALVMLALAGCGGDAAAPISSHTATPAAQANEPLALAQPGPENESVAAADESIEADTPIEIDPELAEADLDGVELEVEPTTNLYVAAYQRSYVAAIRNAWEEKRLGATIAANERGLPAAPAANAAANADSDAAAAQTARGATPPAAQTDASTEVSAAVGSAAAPATESPPPTDEAAVLADAHGQWAVSAEASSYYGGDNGARPRYGAIQATGAPNVARYSDNPNAWTARTGDSPVPEWLSLEYPIAVHATAVKVRQNSGPGAISKLELIDEAGSTHLIWEGTDAVAYPKNTIGWFVRDFPRTDYLVKRVRVTLLTNRVWGWNEIDAAQLVGDKNQ